MQCRCKPSACLTVLLVVAGIGAPLLRARAAEVLLKNGDRITGDYVGEDAERVQWKTEAMGIVSIRKSDIQRLDRQEKVDASSPAPAPEAPLVKWDGEIQAGLDRKIGNTNSLNFNASVLFHRWTRHNEFHLKGNTYESETDGHLDGRKHYGMVRYAFSFGPALKWYDFYRLEAEHDRFANVELRLTPATGVGYWFSDAKPTKLLVELGAGATRTDFRDDTPTSTEAVLMPRLFLEQTFFSKSKLSEDFTSYVTVSDSGAYRFRSETALDVPMNGDLSLRLSLLDEYNDDPGDEARKNDLHLVSGVVYSFL